MLAFRLNLPEMSRELLNRKPAAGFFVREQRTGLAIGEYSYSGGKFRSFSMRWLVSELLRPAIFFATRSRSAAGSRLRLSSTNAAACGRQNVQNVDTTPRHQSSKTADQAG
jgi:hypothetical protein